MKIGPLTIRFGKKPVIEVTTGKVWRESEKGTVEPQRGYSERLPHPPNMPNYDKWANDPEANIAFNVLTDIIAGVGYYTEMPEDVDPKHKNKQIIDEYGESVNLDEDLQQITMAMLQKGFCPVERLKDYDLRVLPPETFYIYRDKKGKILRYTQEYAVGDVQAEWKGNDMNDIVLFFHRKTTSWPYGKSLSEPIGDLLDSRTEMNVDMAKAIKGWAYPLAVMETQGSAEDIKKAMQNRDVDEWIYIGNVIKDEVRWKQIEIDPQARFIPYIELIYYQICEGLHAPLLLYLKNATEASAKVMFESVDRLVNGVQRYIKRRVERLLFEPQVGKPVPRMVWGQPKTGLEKITLSDIAQLYSSGAVKFNQVQDLMKKMGVQLIEPEEEAPKPLPFQLMQPQKPKAQEIPVEQMLEKLNDLQTGLNIIETNYVEKRISIVQAVRLADKTMSVYYKRVYPNEWKSKRDGEFDKFTRRLLQLPKPSVEYKVKVE